jgi:ABC-type sulfate transport system permease subunit
MQDINFTGLGYIGGFFAVVVVIATIILHILFAICIADDITRLRQQGRTTVLLSHLPWILSALLLGLLAVAFYWVCHYSRFGRPEA